MNPGSKLLTAVLLQPRREERLALLNELNHDHLAEGLALVEVMLRTATVLQRPSVEDLIERLRELDADADLQSLFETVLAQPTFPRRHLPWFSTLLDLELDENTLSAFLELPDSDAVLPLLLHRWGQGLWTNELGEQLRESPTERVRLWGRYLSDVHNGTDRSRGPYPLLELNNLEDPNVSEWIESKLETGFYDANILAVCVEREDNRYFEPLWKAVWARPKHKELALRALSVTAPHVPTPVQTLLERITAKPMPRQERQQIAHKLARSFSKVAFLEAQELCMSPIVEQRIIGIEILEFFGSPWHNSRDACVECLLSMLNDIDPRVRARAVEAITSSERRKLAKLNPNKILRGDQPSATDSGWTSLVQELFYASDYQPIREDIWGEESTQASIAFTKAGYRPQDVAGGTTSPAPTQGPTSKEEDTPNLETRTTSAQPRRISSLVRSRYAYAAMIPLLILTGALIYGLMPRETQGSATVMSTPILKGSSAAMGARQFFDDVNLESDKDARSQAELEGAMEIPHAAIMLKRSKCWYLYHRLRPIDSAQYIATAPVPFGDDDPNWELYDTWLLDFIDTEMANGVFDRVGEFVMTIAMVNPPLANQLVPRVLDRASLLDVDSVAKSMVKGGALDLERAIVHPALSDLDANVIDELRDALLTGWKTKEDRVLANYLSDL